MTYLDQKASYTSMQNATQKDFDIILAHDAVFEKGYADRLLSHLKLSDVENDGFPINRYAHALQSATLAQRAEKEEEYIVCALLHDIGDYLSFHNHADIAAGILKPFVSEKNHWMIAKHAIFQGYHFWDKIGLDPNTRDKYQGHPFFEYTAQFCEKFDQNAFDKTYDTLPIEAFEPMVHRVFSQPPKGLS